MDPADAPTPDDPPDIVRRPAGRLHDLPVEVRWEVTRRHPYYLTLWEEVRRYRRGEPGDPPERTFFGYAAMLVLGAIGVSGEPVPPDAPFAELAVGDPAFLGGAVQPMTFRNMVTMLLTALPTAERAFVGAVLLNSATADRAPDRAPDARSAIRSAALNELTRAPSPALDTCPAAPLFYVHLGASQRATVRDMEDQVRRWKARRGDGSSKVHTAKLPGYLRVFDLREGWTGGGYDRGRERSFQAVAKELKLTPSTVAGRYRAAFEAVVGRPFSPELWWRVFGPLKLGRLGGDPAAAYSAGTRHRLHTPVPRPVPDSVVSPAAATARTGTVVERIGAADANFAATDLRLDLRELIARGLPDEEIARKLGLGDPQVVAEFRRYSDEMSWVTQ